MGGLLTGYAMGFNRRHKRSGHLFQNRYKSTVVEYERYFLSLVRYIHLNPIRAGQVGSVSELARYRWGGHSVLMGHQKMRWQDVDEVLSRFARRKERARRELSLFMGQKEADKEEAVFGEERFARNAKNKGRKTRVAGQAGRGKGRDEVENVGVVGEGKFVKATLEEVKTRSVWTPSSENQERRRESFDKLVALVCEMLAVSREELVGAKKRRAVSRARRVLSYLGIRYLGMTAADVGRVLGVSGQGILQGVKQGKSIMTELKLEPEAVVRKLV
jgi:hypothetical protein